jgi:epsilon-lactone hydrolase
MASPESEAIKKLYRGWTQRLASNPQMDLVSLREMAESWTTLASEPEDVTYADVDVGDISGTWCVPRDAHEGRAILFCHGGAFVLGSVSSYRKLAGHLARAVGVRVLVIDYRRAPEHPHPAQVEDCMAAHQWLLHEGFEPHHLVTAGDSAGGFLATMSVIELRKEQTPLPAAIVTLSPWYDLALTGETFETNANLDVLVGKEVMQMFSQLVRGDVPADDPRVNALFAELTGLPPLYIVVGSHEALLSDAQRFAARADAVGGDVTLVVVPEMQHVFPFMAGRAPEADQALADISEWLRTRLMWS